MKKCSRCKKEKPLQEFHFYQSGESKGKPLAHCKECENARTTKWRNNNKERARFLRKRWAEKNRDKLSAYQIEYKKRNAEKIKAHSIVNNAIRCGEIQKPDTCSACGKIRVVNAHHSDYSKPLDIIWLCVQCHINIHKEVFCGKA